MRTAWAWCVVLVWFVTAAFTQDGEAATSDGYLDAGVGTVDITPTDPVVLAGSPETLKSSSVGSRLYARALVLAAGRQKLAIVTLDTLKYPVEHVVRRAQQIERTTGIAASNVIICASHTHRGPLWPYYKDALVTPIAEAVALAVRDLTPCRLGTSKGKAVGVSECRRVIKDGKAWDRWLLPPGEASECPAEGPADPEFDVLVVIGKDRRYKAVVYNFACHAAYTRELVVSADYPGDVQQYVQKYLGYDVPTLFLTGACGDVNPVAYSMADAAFQELVLKGSARGGANPVHDGRRDAFGKELGGEIVRCLGRLEPIANPALYVECREMAMPGREHPEFKREDISLKWPGQLPLFKRSFNYMEKCAKPTYQFFFTGIRIGDDFAIVTNPDELFCGIGMSIKRQSPFKHTNGRGADQRRSWLCAHCQGV